jgi:hypothetical protein
MDMSRIRSSTSTGEYPIYRADDIFLTSVSKYLFIPCHCEAVRSVANTRGAPRLPAGVPVNHRLPTPMERPTVVNTVS